MIRVTTIAALLCLVQLLWAQTVWAETFEVIIEGYQFKPQQLHIKVGDTVRWVNQEKRQYHSVWFEKLGELQPDYFFPGEVFQRDFETKGVFPYRCGPHQKMTGVVHVE